jgi:hypothetical protein
MTEREIERLARRVAERLAGRVAKEIVAELRSDGNLTSAGVPSREGKEKRWRDEAREHEYSDRTRTEEAGESSWSETTATELSVWLRRRRRRSA